MTALHRRDHDHNAAIHFPIQKTGNTLGYWPHTLEPSIQEPRPGLPTQEPDRRYKLASQIEKLEDIELRKQQTLNAIAAGKKSVEDVALERLLQKPRKRKDEPND